MSFDMEPDHDEHAECRHEIHKLKAELAVARQQHEDDVKVIGRLERKLRFACDGGKELTTQREADVAKIAELENQRKWDKDKIDRLYGGIRSAYDLIVTTEPPTPSPPVQGEDSEGVTNP